MLRFMSDLAHSFFSCSYVCFCPCGPFNCISFHRFSLQLSVFLLCSSGLTSALLVLFNYLSLSGLDDNREKNHLCLEFRAICNFSTCQTGASRAIYNFWMCWMGADMYLPRFTEFSGAVLSCFTLSRQTFFLTEVSRIQPEDPPIPLFQATVFSRSWVTETCHSLVDLQ